MDPSRDCKIKCGNGAFVIEMPGTDHDYDPGRDRMNAPRIVRDIEGDFNMQVRARIDCRPSIQSAVKGQPSYVAAGFLVIPRDPFAIVFMRMQYRVAREGTGADGYTTELWRNVKDGFAYTVYDKRWKNWPFKSKPKHVYLRLRRRDDVLLYEISPDGKSWVSVGGGQIIGLPSKLKVGLAAYSTSTEPSRVCFDQLSLSRGKKKK